MARLPRYVAPGIPQHVIQRGNNCQAIFADAADYRVYRDWLSARYTLHYTTQGPTQGQVLPCSTCRRRSKM